MIEFTPDKIEAIRHSHGLPHVRVRLIDSNTRIIILGGGTAGWITANALISRWGGKGVDVTLIESPDIGTVGVGEGSTPRLKVFLDEIGVREREWMPKCNATYKNGISFADWSTRPGFERYFHPFASQTDRFTTTAFYFNTLARRQGVDVHVHPDRFHLTALLSEKRFAPIPSENFPFVLDYGYHFDAHLLGEYLKVLATSRGVRHVQARVTDVKQAPDGDIACLSTDIDEDLAADFFVDCSGFRGALIQGTLGVPFRPFAENLFNDSAVVLPTGQAGNIGSQTISTALKYGWTWEIPLTHRIGNGYVYSSSFCSADDAETELRETLGLLDSEVEARHLQMKVGRVESHWHRNCLAVGLSQGFIEPLEATALNLVCNTVESFLDAVDADAGLSGASRDNVQSARQHGFRARPRLHRRALCPELANRYRLLGTERPEPAYLRPIAADPADLEVRPEPEPGNRAPEDPEQLYAAVVVLPAVRIWLLPGAQGQ